MWHVRKFYDYVYLALYRWNVRVGGQGPTNAFNSSIMVAFVAEIYFLALLFLGDIFLNISFSNTVMKTASVGSALIFMVVHYLYFIKTGRYKDIVESSGNNKLRSRKGRWILALGYIFGAFALFIFSLVIVATYAPK
jgi:hypothetical protein